MWLQLQTSERYSWWLSPIDTFRLSFSLWEVNSTKQVLLQIIHIKIIVSEGEEPFNWFNS